MTEFDFAAGDWLNEPAAYRIDDKSLIATSAAKTDFWRETHYGFIRGNGHFLGFPVGERFTATLAIEGDFATLYDQAGLMLRLDESHWVKAGAEFTSGALHLSTVITNGRSDWSIGRSLGERNSFEVRMTLNNSALRVQARSIGGSWELIRLAPFEAGPGLTVGPMFCSPERGGLDVRFTSFQLGDPIERDLHASD